MENLSLSNFIIDENHTQLYENKIITDFSIDFLSQPEYRKHSKFLKFRNCVFLCDVELILLNQKTYIQIFEIRFTECIFQKKFSVEIFNSENDDNRFLEFYFKDCIGEYFNIGSQTITSIEIINSVFKSFFSSTNSIKTKIAKSKGYYHLNSINESSELFIDYSYQKKYNYIPTKSKFNTETINFINEKLSLETTFDIKGYKIIEIGDFVKSNIIQNVEPINLNIGYTQIDSIIKVRNLIFNKIEITYVANNEFVALFDINFRHLNFNNLNVGKMILNNIYSNQELKDTSFELNNVHNDNGEFTFVDLKKVNNVVFEKYSIENTQIISSSFPDKIEFTSDKNLDSRKDILGYEFYRQLKTAFLRNNNTVQALEAHSKMYEYAKKREDLDKWDRFILCMNHWSN